MGFKKGHIPWNTGKKVHLSLKTEFKKGEHCSRATEFKKGVSGEKSGHWCGGRIIDKCGYILIYKPEHSFANNQGYIREHRLVIEKDIGRLLTKEERIHHINGIKNDNRLENLMLFPNNGTHSAHHFTGKKRPPYIGEKISMALKGHPNFKFGGCARIIVK